MPNNLGKKHIKTGGQVLLSDGIRIRELTNHYDDDVIGGEAHGLSILPEIAVLLAVLFVNNLNKRYMYMKPGYLLLFIFGILIFDTLFNRKIREGWYNTVNRPTNEIATTCAKCTGAPCCALWPIIKARRDPEWQRSYTRMYNREKQRWKDSYNKWYASARSKWDSDTKAFKKLAANCKLAKRKFRKDPQTGKWIKR